MLKLILVINVMVGMSFACQSPGVVTKDGSFSTRTVGYTDGCWLSDYSPGRESLYVLPYAIGKSYGISQGNCGKYTHTIVDNNPGVKVGDLRYAYDFAIPVGDEIIAARQGIVVNIEESFPNFTNLNSHTNYIAVSHEDGTIATYIHLSPNGVLVNLSDEVSQGQVIAVAGNSGYTGGYPHLHFQVFEKEHEKCRLKSFSFKQPRDNVINGCKTIPITFKNADPQDSPLIEGVTYTAQ